MKSLQVMEADDAEIKASTELKTDIYSNLISSTIPGYQF